MYSGLLPNDLREEDLSPLEECEEEGNVVEVKGTKELESYAEKCSFAGENRGTVLETKSLLPVSDGNSEPPGICVTGKTKEMWQKFQDLQKKNNEMKSTRIPRQRKRRRQKKGAESSKSTETRDHQGEREKHWNGLKQYFGVNDQFHPPACANPPLKSGLEKSIERAIAEGDFAKAEEMSDRLATRELAVKIAEAIDCRDFMQHKQEEEALRAAQNKKKQIAWGFEPKKRWETKSNMGYM